MKSLLKIAFIIMLTVLTFSCKKEQQPIQATQGVKITYLKTLITENCRATNVVFTSPNCISFTQITGDSETTPRSVCKVDESIYFQIINL